MLVQLAKQMMMALQRGRHAPSCGWPNVCMGSGGGLGHNSALDLRGCWRIPHPLCHFYEQWHCPKTLTLDYLLHFCSIPTSFADLRSPAEAFDFCRSVTQQRVFYSPWSPRRWESSDPSLISVIFASKPVLDADYQVAVGIGSSGQLVLNQQLQRFISLQRLMDENIRNKTAFACSFEIHQFKDFLFGSQ